MKNLLTILLIIISTACFSQKRDTVEVLMLVSENKSWDDPWTQKGFEVRFTNEHGFMNYVEHLDKNKKRLPLNLVVWISKEIFQ